MRVLVTGGTGLIGRAAVERLLQHGWDVRVIDIGQGTRLDGADYVECNILNYDDVLRATRGCDAVVHMAALRMPSLAPGHELFQINVQGTFNIFEAAAAVGIRRIVQASSINALGSTYSLPDIKVDYFPIDEAHPTFTTDPYSFSKQTDEAIGAYYWRRDGLSSVAYRFPGVYRPDYRVSDELEKRRRENFRVIDQLLSLSDAERKARLAAVHQRVLDFRGGRPMEWSPDGPIKVRYKDDPLFYIYLFERFNLWVILDERDAAQSIENGLTADFEGAHALFINDSHNWMGCDSRMLTDLFFPDAAVRPTLSGDTPLVSIDQARRLIGFEPEYSAQRSQS